MKSQIKLNGNPPSNINCNSAEMLLGKLRLWTFLWIYYNLKHTVGFKSTSSLEILQRF